MYLKDTQKTSQATLDASLLIHFTGSRILRVLVVFDATARYYPVVVIATARNQQYLEKKKTNKSMKQPEFIDSLCQKQKRPTSVSFSFLTHTQAARFLKPSTSYTRFCSGLLLFSLTILVVAINSPRFDFNFNCN